MCVYIYIYIHMYMIYIYLPPSPIAAQEPHEIIINIGINTITNIDYDSNHDLGV